MKKIRFQSFVFLLLLIPGQISLLDSDAGTIVSRDTTYEDFQNMFQLAHQILYYQADLEGYINSTSNNRVKKYLSSIDSLQRLSRAAGDQSEWLAKGVLLNFKSQVDPLVKSKLSNLESNPLFQVLYAEVFPLIKAHQKDFLQELENGTVRFIKYLPQRYQQEYENDLKVLASNAKKKAIGGTYNRLIAVLKQLRPMYKYLLEDSALTIGDITEAYIKVKSQEYLIELLYYFLRQPDSRKMLGFTNRDIETIYLRLQDYMKYSVASAEMLRSSAGQKEKLEKYLNKYNAEYFRLREVVIREISTLIDEIFEIVATESVSSVEDYITNHPVVEQYSRKINEYFADRESDTEYIDIKTARDSKHWVRLKLPSGTAQALESKSGRLENLTGELYLVYRPKMKDDDIIFHGKKLFKKDSLSASELQKALESVRNVHVEIPLGLKIYDLIVSTKDIQNTYSATLHSTNTDVPKVSVTFKAAGIWTNFKYIEEKNALVVEQLQLPLALGLHIDRIEINPQTWDPKIVFDWQPKGFLSDALSHYHNQISIQLSKVEQDGKDFKDAIGKQIKTALARQLKTQLENRREALQEILFAEEVKIGNIDFGTDTMRNNAGVVVDVVKNDLLEGRISVKPKGLSFLFEDEKTPFIPLDFRLYMREGYPRFEVSKPGIPVTYYFEEQVKKKLQETVESLQLPVLENAEALKRVVTNVYEEFGISDLQIDIHERNACANITLRALDNATAPICFNFNTNKFSYSAFELLLKQKIKAYIRNNITGFFEDQFKQVTIATVENLCDNVPEQFELFTLQFVKKKVEGCEVTASLLDGLSEVTVKFSANGIELKAFDPTAELKQRIIANFSDVIAQYDGLVTMQSPRFNGGQFKVDLVTNISKSPEFAFLDVGTTVIGTVSIGADGSVTFQGANLGDTIDLVKGKIIAELDKTISASLKNALPPKIDFGGQALIRIKDVVSDLANNKVDIRGEVVFESLNGLKLDGIILRIDPKKLSVKLIVEGADDALNSLVAGLANNFMSSILEASCEGDIGICDTYFDPKSLTLTGVIKINITDVITFPGIEFTLTPKKFTYTFAPQITLYGSYPVGPGVVAIDPTLRFDFKENKVYGTTTVTLGATEEARATARVAKISTKLTIDIASFKRIDYKGTFLVVSVIPLYYGKGYIDLETASFGMSEGTSELLSKVIHYERRMDFYGKHPDFKERSMKGSAELKLLGMGAELRLEGQTHTGYIAFDGSGTINIPLVSLSGKVGTRYIPYLPVSHLLYGYGKLWGDFSISDFKLAGFDLRVDIHEANAAFEVLGAKLGLTVPVVDAVTEGKILDLILNMFEFEVDDLAKLLDEIANFKSVELSFGGDDDADGGKQQYKEGSGGQEGATSSTFDDVYEDTGVSGTAVAKGQIVNLNLAMEKVNHSLPRVISEKVGRKCTKFGFVKWSCRDVYRNRTIQDETFNFSKWGSYWTCLPSGWKNYYAIYDPNSSGHPSKRKVYDLVHPDVGDKLKNKTLFLMRTPLEASKRTISGQTQLCLSKENGIASGGSERCIPANNFADTLFNSISLFGNLAYDASHIYIFTSARLPEPANKFCSSGSRMEQFTVDGFLSNVSNQKPMSNISCLDCIQLKGSEETSRKKQTISAVSGFTVTSKVKSKNPEQAFTSIGNPGKGILQQFMQIVSIDEEPEKEFEDDKTTGADTVDIEEYQKLLREKTKNLEIGSIILFDRGTMIIADKKESKFRAEVFAIDASKGEDKFYQLTAKTWLKIPGDNFKAMLSGNLNSDELTLKEVFSILTNEDSKFFYKIRPLLNEYVQNWIYYGRDPNTIRVKTSSPNYTFNIWDCSKLKNDRKNFSYTFTELKKGNNPLKIKGSYHKLFVSDLTKQIGISESTTLTSHQSLIENECNTNVYRNLLFFHARDTLNDRVLISANPKRVVYGTVTSSPNALDQEMKLTIVNAGCGGTFDMRQNAQLHNLGFQLRSNETELDVDIKKHDQFYNLIIDRLERDTASHAYVEKFPLDSINFRAVIFTGNQAELIWEKSGGQIGAKVINLNYTSRWQQFTSNPDDQFYEKRIFLNKASARSEQARIILSWFDGFNEWYQVNGHVNPAALLRK